MTAYGDVTPVTTARRLFGAFVAVLGVGMAALPTGILASGLAGDCALPDAPSPLSGFADMMSGR